MIASILINIGLATVGILASAFVLGVFFLEAYRHTDEGREMGIADPADTDFVDTDFPPPAPGARRLPAEDSF